MSCIGITDSCFGSHEDNFKG